MTDYTMQEATPPQRAGLLGDDAEMYEARRKQLRENPHKWFLWQDDAHSDQVIGKVMLLLSGYPSGAARYVSRKTLDYKGRTRRNGDGTYSLFISYVPKGGEQ